MATTYIGERPSGRTTSDEWSKANISKTFSETHVVQADSVNDDAESIKQTSGVPKVGDPNQAVPTAICTSVEADESESNGVDFFLWECEVTFETQVPAKEQAEDPEQPPEDQKPVWKFDGEIIQTAVTQDQIDNRPMQYGSGQPFALEGGEPVGLWNVTLYERFVAAQLPNVIIQVYFDFLNRINSVAFFGANPYFVMLSNITMEPAWLDDDPGLHQVSYTFKYRTGPTVLTQDAAQDEQFGWRTMLEHRSNKARTAAPDPAQAVYRKPDGVVTFNAAESETKVPENVYLQFDGTISGSEGTVRTTLGPWSRFKTADFNTLPGFQ